MLEMWKRIFIISILNWKNFTYYPVISLYLSLFKWSNFCVDFAPYKYIGFTTSRFMHICMSHRVNTLSKPFENMLRVHRVCLNGLKWQWTVHFKVYKWILNTKRDLKRIIHLADILYTFYQKETETVRILPLIYFLPTCQNSPQKENQCVRF